MGTIITEATRFLECAGNDVFIESIYPEGVGEALIGKFGLDQGRFSMNLHIYTEPAKKIPKWGVWGANYNVVVLKFIGDGLKVIKVENWECFGKAELLCNWDGDRYCISQRGPTWEFEVLFGILVFQGAETYVDEQARG